MRQIIFRGQRADTKEWIEGSLAYSITGKPMIMPETICSEKDIDLIALATSYLNRQQLGWFYFVIPATVGQFTGLADKNGKRIFEGDVLKYGDNYPQKYIVKFGKYNKHCGIGCVPAYLGAAFYLDGNSAFETHEAVHGIIDVNGYAHIYPPDSEWNNRMQDYHRIWGLEIIGTIHDNPELFKK